MNDQGQAHWGSERRDVQESTAAVQRPGGRIGRWLGTSVLIIISMLVGAGVVLVLPGVRSEPIATLPSANTSAPVTREETGATVFGADPVAIYERARPSVAKIETAVQRGFNSREGIGTGIVLDKEGHILTNHHVVAGAREIVVTLGNGARGTAELVGSDPGNDLAVIKADIARDKLQPAALGDSDQVRVGEPVFALGNPLGQDFSLTSGIVSALGRRSTGTNNRVIRNVIQTDAPVNPGNSGGPLLNARGEVIGITASLENPTGQNLFVGLAFAIPINTAKRFIPDMTAGKAVDHPRLGISSQVRTSLSEGPSQGVRISRVEENSPAARAGLQSGDVILALDGKLIREFDDIVDYLDSRRVGDRVKVKVLRDGRELTLEVTLGAWNSST